MLISRRWDEDRDRVWYDKFKENITMTYAHAIDLINQSDPDGIPVWLYGCCNADFVKKNPDFVKKYFFDRVLVRSDGTLFEILEEE